MKGPWQMCKREENVKIDYEDEVIDYMVSLPYCLWE